jgi:hypothetical protein
MSETFVLVDENPNPGEGCACKRSKDPDSEGPYAVFPATASDDPLNPHIVVCFGCACAVTKDTKDGLEPLAALDDDIPEV